MHHNHKNSYFAFGIIFPTYGVFTVPDTKTDINTDSHWVLCEFIGIRLLGVG